VIFYNRTENTAQLFQKLTSFEILAMYEHHLNR